MDKLLQISHKGEPNQLLQLYVRIQMRQTRVVVCLFWLCLLFTSAEIVTRLWHPSVSVSREHCCTTLNIKVLIRFGAVFAIGIFYI